MSSKKTVLEENPDLEPMPQEYQEMMDRDKVGKAGVISELIDPIPVPKSELLELCAQEIIKVLDKPTQDFIIEVSQIILHVPLWQLVVGHLRLAADRGELQAPWLDPSWSDGSGNVVELAEVVCKHCDQSFSPVRLGQVYCCNGCSAGKGHSSLCIFYVELGKDNE